MPEIDPRLVAELEKLRSKIYFAGRDVPPTQPVWRYISVEKFNSLLSNRTLYFCRADKFDDPREGTFPDSHWLNAARAAHSAEKGGTTADPWEYLAFLKMTLKLSRACYLISCWRTDTHARASMFRRYGCQETGIALGTDLRSLLASIQGPPRVHVATVSYEDFGSLATPQTPRLAYELFPIVIKRKQFSWEREVRLFLHDKVGFANRKPSFEHGHALDVKLNTLIKQVAVSVDARAHIREAVRKQLRSHALEDRLLGSEAIELDGLSDEASYSTENLLPSQQQQDKRREAARDAARAKLQDDDLRKKLNSIGGISDKAYFLAGRGRDALVEDFLYIRHQIRIARYLSAENDLPGSLSSATRALEIALSARLGGAMLAALALIAEILQDGRFQVRTEHAVDFQELVFAVRRVHNLYYKEKFHVLELIRKCRARSNPDRDLEGIDDYF